MTARPDWNEVLRDTAAGPDDSRNDLLLVTRETLRISLSALKQDAAEDYYHNVGAAIREISAVLSPPDEAKLTANQRETLRVLGDGDWYEVSRCADEFRRTFPSLVRRGQPRTEYHSPMSATLFRGAAIPALLFRTHSGSSGLCFMKQCHSPASRSREMSDERPKRIQRRRTKGWQMPDGAVNVCRPSRWGNPFRVGDFGIPTAAEAVERYTQWLDGRIVGPTPPHRTTIRRELAGKDLACWCPLDAVCHADVLLELANKATPDD